LDKDGNLGQSIQEKSYFNKGPNPNRQEKSHMHEVVFHPTEKILFVTDLGGDIIQQIPFDEDSLTPLQLDNSSEIKLTSGVGPRHLLFTKNGKMAYATFELTNQLGIFSFENKQLKFIKAIPLTDEDFTENGSAAELRLSNDDKFLYVSLRGDFNVLVGLDVSDATNPKEIQRIETQIKPRNFIITSSENYILVGNEISNSIISFKRNKKTGLLQKTKLVYPMHKPTYFFNF
jgi:6-phosphogluconolactonase